MAGIARIMNAFGALRRQGNLAIVSRMRALQNPDSGFSAFRKMEHYLRFYPRCGGWTPITDINNPQVTEIANFAVTEYGKQSGAKLKLVRVVRGEHGLVAGLVHRLVFEAADGTATRTYEAVVFDRSWQNLRELTSFKSRPSFIKLLIGRLLGHNRFFHR